jgi:hypothetical protein
MATGYGDLANGFGWRDGVHKAPVGYQHPWLVVTDGGTFGAWSREKARVGWDTYKAIRDLDAAEQAAERGF